MRGFISSAAPLALICLAGITNVFAHGGTYRGPGDFVPPAGASPIPTTGAPAPGKPGGPNTGAPPGAIPPGGYPPSTGGPPSGPGQRGVNTGSVDTTNLSSWVYWWELNKAPFLQLQNAVFRGEIVTGSDDDFIGGKEGRRKAARDLLRPSESQVRGQVVPALRKVLDEETNNDLVTGALIALAKIGKDPSLVPLFMKWLPDQNQEIAETAALAMGICAEPGAIEPLLHLVRDDEEGRKLVKGSQVNFRTRGFAAYGIGLIAANAERSDTRQQCIQILRETLASDQSKQKDVKVACILSLGLIRSEDLVALEDLRRILIDKDNKQEEIIRAHCPLAMAKLFGGQNHPLKQTVISEMLELLKNRKEKNHVRQSLVYALGMMSKAGQDEYETVVRALQSAYKESTDEQERYFALIGLGKLGGPDAEYFLMQQLGSARNAMARPWAAIGLAILGRNKLEAAPGEMGSQIYEKLQEVFLKTSDPETKSAYAIALGIVRDKTAKEILLKTVRESNSDELQGYACVALGMIDDRSEEVISTMKDVVQKSKRKGELLKQAAIGLGLLGDKNLVQYFLDRLADPQNRSLAVQAALAQALGYIGDQRSLSPLVELLDNKALQAGARSFAAAALGIICDKETLPWNSKYTVDLNYRAAVTTLSDKSGSTGIADIL